MYFYNNPPYFSFVYLCVQLQLNEKNNIECNQEVLFHVLCCFFFTGCNKIPLSLPYKPEAIKLFLHSQWITIKHSYNILARRELCLFCHECGSGVGRTKLLPPLFHLHLRCFRKKNTVQQNAVQISRVWNAKYRTSKPMSSSQNCTMGPGAARIKLQYQKEFNQRFSQAISGFIVVGNNTGHSNVWRLKEGAQRQRRQREKQNYHSSDLCAQLEPWIHLSGKWYEPSKQLSHFIIKLPSFQPI